MIGSYFHEAAQKMRDWFEICFFLGANVASLVAIQGASDHLVLSLNIQKHALENGNISGDHYKRKNKYLNYI